MLLAVATSCLTFINISARDNVDRVTQGQQAGQFLHYVSAFNDLWTHYTR